MSKLSAVAGTAMSKLSAVAGAAMSKLSTAPEERARILIVDDEPAALLTLQAVLEEFHDVEAVANAVQAEAVLAKSNIQILLTDYEMPAAPAWISSTWCSRSIRTSCRSC